MKNLKLRVQIAYYENGAKLIQLVECGDKVLEWLDMLINIFWGG